MAATVKGGTYAYASLRVMIILDPTLDGARWPRRWSSSLSVVRNEGGSVEGRRVGWRRRSPDIGKNSGHLRRHRPHRKPTRSTSSTASST